MSSNQWDRPWNKELTRKLLKLDRQRARAERLHEKRPDIYPWPSTFEDIFPKVVREEIIDYAIKEGLTDDPGVSGGIAALKNYDCQYEKIFGPKRVKAPEVFCVSTANSDDALHRYMLESLKLEEENLKAKEYLFGTPKFVISGDYIPFEWLKGNPNLGLVQPYCKIELNNEKEKEKMNAKRCDRCGKLYVPNDEPRIRAYLCGRVTEHEKETYTPEKIKEYNTFLLHVILEADSKKVDMCPDCLKKLKEFFESGADEVNKEN